MKILRRLGVALFSLAWLALAPAASAEPILVGETSTLTSKVLGEERTLMVALPRGYAGSEARYPVLYLLDAETRFHHTVGTVETLSRIGQVPQMIVVGLTNTDRTRDLTPPWTRPDPPEDRTAIIAAGGGADDFLRFFGDELIPHVEAAYRTAPYRILVGHSFGGLFAVHAQATAPDLFDAVLAVSPSLWWDEGRPVERMAELLAGRPDLGGRFYATLADEGGDMLARFRELATLLRYRAPKGFVWEARVLDGENHGSIPVPSVHLGLKAFYPTWQAPPFVFAEGLDGVDRHYAGLSAEYGYELKTPEALINRLGYQALAAEETEEAIGIFRANVERHPGSANVYDSLGEGLEAAGRLEEARDHYRRAVEMGREAEDPNLGAYRGHLEAVKEKLAASK